MISLLAPGVATGVPWLSSGATRCKGALQSSTAEAWGRRWTKSSGARSHAIDDLGIDSLAFLDIAFAIDKAFGIKLPLEQWTQEVNEGKAPAEQYFVLENLCKRIDELVAAKKA